MIFLLHLAAFIGVFIVGVLLGAALTESDWRERFKQSKIPLMELAEPTDVTLDGEVELIDFGS